MSFKQNIKPVAGTKRFEYSCMQCGFRKESYKTGANKLKYCSSKCASAYRKNNILTINSGLISNLSKATLVETDRNIIRDRFPMISSGLSFLILVTQIIILILLHGSKLHASDPIDIPKRLCRSPKSHSLNKLHIYVTAAEIMGTTPSVMQEIASYKVENHGHIETVAACYDEKEFERSRTILSSEIQAFFYRNVKAWAEYCSD